MCAWRYQLAMNFVAEIVFGTSSTSTITGIAAITAAIQHCATSGSEDERDQRDRGDAVAGVAPAPSRRRCETRGWRKSRRRCRMSRRRIESRAASEKSAAGRRADSQSNVLRAGSDQIASIDRGMIANDHRGLEVGAHGEEIAPAARSRGGRDRDAFQRRTQNRRADHRSASAYRPVSRLHKTPTVDAANARKRPRPVRMYRRIPRIAR